ncbi:hypothetical protein E5288_WYG000073 [Bos mutus]|uniref:GUCT domain-containing protein n=1 Tax=Bos mutus TaxID=72004 RepID=A0A6B0RHK0_9CETA|nr:hypothetical protein [Bos mutus]
MLIEEKGDVETLAHIFGATSVDQSLLISSKADFVTMILWYSIGMPNISYAWKGLKEQLGEDIDSKVKGMVFVKGKQGVCFDIPTAPGTEVQKSGMMHGAGCFLWSRSNQSWKVHGKDMATSEDSGKAIKASGDSTRATEGSGDSGKELGASEDSDQDVATKATDSKTKARSGVSIKHLDSN